MWILGWWLWSPPNQLLANIHDWASHSQVYCSILTLLVIWVSFGARVHQPGWYTIAISWMADASTPLLVHSRDNSHEPLECFPAWFQAFRHENESSTILFCMFAYTYHKCRILKDNGFRHHLPPLLLRQPKQQSFCKWTFVDVLRLCRSFLLILKKNLFILSENTFWTLWAKRISSVLYQLQLGLNAIIPWKIYPSPHNLARNTWPTIKILFSQY